ncbi:MAG TPA: serine/threonine-protein kinase [Kofleriaceae bacterium]|nr:serine/threonine-protein kinase [Kofleriaceae bacterium]
MVRGDAGAAPTGADLAVEPVAPPRAATQLADGPAADPQRALWQEEATRAGGFGLVLALVCLLALPTLPFHGGDVLLQALTAVGLGALALVGLWVRRRVGQGRYTRPVFRVFLVSAAAVSFVVQYYVGFFSAAPTIVAIGITFFALGDDHRWAIGASIAVSAAYAVMATAFTFDLIPDPGLVVAGDHVPRSVRIWAVFLIPVIFLTAVWQARLSRRATYDAVTRLGAALRLAQEREAQLREAQRELDVALEAGAGGAGVHTGRRAGSYLLGTVIGRGGVGEVYRASHEQTGERAAVKVLHTHLLRDEAQLTRFQREARATEELRSPHVVSVFESGLIDGRAPYLAMELLSGHDLAWHLRSTGRLSLPDALALARQVAVGLDAAHATGVVHRDIQPRNLFLAERSTGTAWIILDFGISKLQGTSGTLTEGMVIGTPSYMAPEQARGRASDVRADVFSLAAVLYRALTGRPPFGGSDLPSILYDLVFETPPLPSALNPELPRAIDDVIMRGLAKEAEARFASAGAFAAALAAAASL